MIAFVIHGSRYALVGENVTYDIEMLQLPPNVSPENIKITWYKDDKPIKQYDWESQYTLELYDVGYPAEGDYYATVEVGEHFGRALPIHLEIGTVERQVRVRVNSRTIVEAEIGDTVQLHPDCQAFPPYAHLTAQWTKGSNPTPLGPTQYISIPIHSDDDYDTYTLHTEAFAHGGFLPAHQEDHLKIVPPGSIEAECPLIYTHDLIPGRDASYIRIGWWVMEEIFELNKAGFDWETDPFHPRIKYKCELANIVEALKKWPNIELQESRHGYVATHKDLHRTNLDEHKGLRPT